MMIRYFLFFSILAITCLVTLSCSKNLYPLKTGNAAIISADDKVQKYDLTMNFMGKHFNGLLMTRRMDSGEIRILASTPFGLSLFDFGLNNEKFEVYSCIEPMRKERILKIFETDFKLLFLPEREIKKIEKENDYTKFVTGGGFSKSVVNVDETKTNIKIKHPWLRLGIQLQKINENDDVAE